jgi:hypothetical protein
MSGDSTKPPAKIACATMSGDQMDALHQALDAEIQKVQAKFGQSHPMWITGHAVKTIDTLKNTSPIDTRILLGNFARGNWGPRGERPRSMGSADTPLVRSIPTGRATVCCSGPSAAGSLLVRPSSRG